MSRRKQKLCPVARWARDGEVRRIINAPLAAPNYIQQEVKSVARKIAEHYGVILNNA